MPLYGKVLEVRDRGTFIPVLAIRLWSDLNPVHYYVGRAGYSKQDPSIALMKLDGLGMVTIEPGDWETSRTMKVAHIYIIENYDRLGDGTVVDVEHILKETKRAKNSERFG